MAAPITFRNVPGAAAPNFGAELHAMQRAAQGPNLFDVFGEVGQDAVDFKQKQDTDAFVAKLNSFRDEDLGDGQGIVTADMQRQQFLQDQLAQNSFIDAGVATQGVTANRAQDFLKNAEGRAVASDTRAEEAHDDQLLTNAGARGTREITNQLLNQDIAANDVRLDADKLKLKSGQRVEKQAAVDQERTETNRTMQSTPVFGQHEFLVMNPRLASDPDNASVTDYLNTDAAMMNALREEYPNLSYEQYVAKIEKSYKDNGLDIPRNAVFAQAKRTPAGKLAFNKAQTDAKRNFNYDNKITNTLEKASNLKDDKAFVDSYGEFIKDFRKFPRTAEQTERQQQFKAEAMRRYVPDVSNDPIIAAKVEDIGPQQIAEFTRRTARKIYQRFPDAAESEVLSLVRLAGDTGAQGLRTKLNTAEATAQIQAEIGQLGRQLAKRKIIAPAEAEVKALEGHVDETADVDERKTGRSKVRLDILDALKPGGKLNLEGVEVDQEELGVQTTRMFDLLDKALPEAGEATKAEIIKELMLSQGGVAKGTIKNLFTQGFDTFDDQPGLSDDEGEVEPLSEFNDAELIDRLLSTAAHKKNQSKAAKIKELKNQLKALEK